MGRVVSTLTLFRSCPWPYYVVLRSGHGPPAARTLAPPTRTSAQERPAGPALDTVTYRSRSVPINSASTEPQPDRKQAQPDLYQPIRFGLGQRDSGNYFTTQGRLSPLNAPMPSPPAPRLGSELVSWWGVFSPGGQLHSPACRFGVRGCGACLCAVVVQAGTWRPLGFWVSPAELAA